MNKDKIVETAIVINTLWINCQNVTKKLEIYWIYINIV